MRVERLIQKKRSSTGAEAELAERELAEMMTALKSANAGVGSNTDPTAPPRGTISDEELGLRNDSKLNDEFNNLARAHKRDEADADAEARLAELKKKMGQ